VQLTAQNYYSKAADNHYMSVSQYKKWLECEFAALAWLKGEYQPEPSVAMLEGSFLHAWNDGTLDTFQCEHPEMFLSRGKTQGDLKSNFLHCNTMISTLESDPKAMFFLQGQKEVILTANLFGVPWKIRIDVDNPELKFLSDLKTTKSISEFTWSRERGQRISFIEEWQYPLQAAVYSEVERIARGREDYRNFYIVAVSKEKVPDHDIFDLTDPGRLQEELTHVERNMSRIVQVKSGAISPIRCGRCEHCRATKRVGKIIHYTEMAEAV
jgi:hypothetical protein